MALAASKSFLNTSASLFDTIRDHLSHWAFRVAGLVSVILIVGFFYVLGKETALAFDKFGLAFLTTNNWDPVQLQFGAFASIAGTLISTGLALLFAVPLSFGIALLITEYAPAWLAKPIGFVIELLAAIPSIIYGMWGLFIFAPFVASTIQPFLTRHLFFLPGFDGPQMGIGILTAGMILALMILPYISSMLREIFLIVPNVLKESAHGIGATPFEVFYKVTLPYSAQGVLGAIFIGLGRAIGETMAVAFVIGNSQNIPNSLYAAGTTIASTIASEFAEATEPMHLSALTYLAVILLFITFILQVLSRMLIKQVSKK